ncbi:chitosanase [Cryptosporangium phraense]|uniref:Chitosanase n=1 Tax=Cryptosporangium phraense TaxID=2593070 RepID=A0A545AXX0_9ACTN|nr:chitosanase [Cryptosporangium phraense]TQS46170.1 chitosanase [Cryptosporangium phraense]
MKHAAVRTGLVAAVLTVALLPAAPAGAVTALDTPRGKDLAMRLVSSAENSTLDWRAQYAYIEDIGDGRGYTGGIIGFCSGTSDMLAVVVRYTARRPGNRLARFLPALARVDGTASHSGLGAPFVAAWRAAASDPAFRAAQDEERDRSYLGPAVRRAKADGLHALGQFIYFDAIVMHGPGTDPRSFSGIRATAMRLARTPAQGGSERAYLSAFLTARRAVMRAEGLDTSRIDTEQRPFLAAGNLTLAAPLTWKTYGTTYTITAP